MVTELFVLLVEISKVLGTTPNFDVGRVARNTVPHQQQQSMLDIPPRFMWGWGPGVSGYCGSMTIQTTAIYYGSYISEDRVRGMTGGHGGNHEILLGRGGCCSAIDIMPQFALNVTQWKFWKEPQPQHESFLNWMEDAVNDGEPVAFGVYMKTEEDPDFDHIVPLVGFTGGSGSGRRLVFNDLHANASLALPISTFVSKRDECKAKLPWKERFAYCLPFDVNYGIRVHGNVDRYNELLPARLIMDEWTEPDYSKEDGKGESPKMLGASIVASGLQSGSRYALLQYDDPTLVPHSNFLSNKTGGIVSRVDFVASGQTYSHRVAFMSDSTTFYRVVQKPASSDAFSPPPPKPILPHSWSGNLTVERRNGGVPEYTGWQYTSYDQCATRTIELNSRMGNHTAIYYHNYGNSTGQCILRDQAPKCSRGFLPVGPCPWGIDALKYASYHGTTPFGQRSCDGWLDNRTGSIYYVDASDHLPCGFVGPDGGKITFENVSVGEAPSGAFDCPC